ncbi:MAG: amino acid permease [Bacteroidota bacterium]|nr:amino acid permease [Bacteroidota bacterium]
MKEAGLKQTIGFWAAVSIIAGSIIGSGVFMKPASMASQTGSPLWMTVVWIIAGVFSLAGALIYAEAGAMLPETGGQYVYFRYMYGKFVAFLYGWAAFSVINTAAVAAISFVCAQYADYFLHLPRLSTSAEHSLVWHIPLLGNLYPLENIGVKSLAGGMIVVLTLVNYLSVRAGSALQVVSTFVKIAVIVALVAGIFFSGHGSASNFIQAPSAKHGMSLFSGLIGALTGAFMAYDGWVNITFLGGEIKNPQRNIPRSLFTGVLLCIIVYVLVNQAYLWVLPVDKVAASPLVAADAIAAAWGSKGAALVAAMIVICTFGATNGNIMSVARVTYAMSIDKIFFNWTGREHPRFRTPGNALLLHGAWSMVLVMSGSFDMLADMFTFVSWVAYLLGAIGIFVLRKKMPDTARPYRAFGYPLMAVLFILFAAFYVVSTVVNDISNYRAGTAPVVNSVLGLAITALGIPLYLYFRYKRRRTISQVST